MNPEQVSGGIGNEKADTLHGYRFVDPDGEPVYNATILFYFLRYFTRYGEYYELCSRYLSKWFTWNVERSYPKGRTDLEFVGKYSECFAGVRMVIEFKYFSNARNRNSNRSKKCWWCPCLKNKRMQN